MGGSNSYRLNRASESEENYHLYRFSLDKSDRSLKRNLHNLQWHAQSVIK